MVGFPSYLLEESIDLEYDRNFKREKHKVGKVITVWSRFNKQTKKYEFNHISDGYDEILEKPNSEIPKQKKEWSTSKWKKEEAKLINGRVVRV